MKNNIALGLIALMIVLAVAVPIQSTISDIHVAVSRYDGIYYINTTSLLKVSDQYGQTNSFSGPSIAYDGDVAIAYKYRDIFDRTTIGYSSDASGWIPEKVASVPTSASVRRDYSFPKLILNNETPYLFFGQGGV